MPNAGMAYVPNAAERNTRDDLVRVATLYPAGLRAGSFLSPDVPMSSDGYRFENGQKMAGPGCVFPPPSCKNMKDWQNFGPGAVPGATGSPNTIVTFEAFKVYGGRIHGAEAVLETLPIGAPSGWGK